MDITINGQSKAVSDGADLAAVLRDYGVAERGVAVAVNGDVVPRAGWSGTEIHSGAVIEVLTAVQGG